MYKNLKRYIYNKLIPLIKVIKYIKWIYYLKFQKNISLIIGAGSTKIKGWFPTDINTLDVTKEKDFSRYFQKRKIHKILAEHVLEHLSSREIEKMLYNIYKYSHTDLVFRVAVPDGYHPDKNYINTVRPGGSGEGAEDHKQLFNYESLSSIFKKSGFKEKLIEYWDEYGNFHSTYTDENGYIGRSFMNDQRNRNEQPNYTSLIIDFYKNCYIDPI